MALTPPKVVDIDDPLTPRKQPQPAPAASAPPSETRPPRRRRARSQAPSQPSSEAPPKKSAPGVIGSPKVTISMRAPTAAWDHLGSLARRLEDEGLRTSRTEITEALWHFNAPADVDEARELVRRYRRAQLD
jgi:hypothetical protein